MNERTCASCGSLTCSRDEDCPTCDRCGRRGHLSCTSSSTDQRPYLREGHQPPACLQVWRVGHRAFVVVDVRTLERGWRVSCGDLTEVFSPDNPWPPEGAFMVSP